MNEKLYGADRLPFDKLGARGKLLHALAFGAKLSPMTAVTIANTAEATRRLREIGEDHPLCKEWKEGNGTRYYLYYFEPDYAKELKCNMYHDA